MAWAFIISGNDMSTLFNGLLEDIISKKQSIAVVGLGYVGMPIAVAFAKKVDVIGFDNNSAKIEL